VHAQFMARWAAAAGLGHRGGAKRTAGVMERTPGRREEPAATSKWEMGMSVNGARPTGEPMLPPSRAPYNALTVKAA
jgi:hypothetical protein